MTIEGTKTKFEVCVEYSRSYFYAYFYIKHNFISNIWFALVDHAR
jgi:hypothetical protein